MRPLVYRIADFVGTNSWEEARQVLDQSPELLSDEADSLLGRLIEAAEAQGDLNKSTIYAKHRDLLRRCRTVGLEQAFAELMPQVEQLLIPNEFRAVFHQAQVALKQYEQNGNPADLDQVVELSLSILSQPEFANTPLRFRLNLLSDTAGVLVRRYWLTSELRDLDQSLELWRLARTLLPVDSPDRDKLLNNMGTGISARYERTGDMSDLEAAIECYHQALLCVPSDSPNRDGYASNLGNGLRDRYTRTGNPVDLEEAIATYRQALQMAPPASKNIAMHHNNLATALNDRYDLTGEANDLTEALESWRKAVTLSPPNSMDRAMYLSNLGVGLHDRFVAGGDLADLEEAIEAYEQAVRIAPLNYTQRPGYLSNLGNGLRERYAHTGNLNDLDQAIANYRQACQLIPSTSPEFPGFLNNLGSSLHERYDRTGDLIDLDQAIICWQEAVRLTPPNSPELPDYLNNLTSGFHTRYSRRGNLPDLEEAIAGARRVIELVPLTFVRRAIYHNNLGNYLRSSYLHSRNVAELNEAVNHHKLAVQLTAVNSPSWFMYVGNLGIDLYSRFTLTGELSELENLITMWRLVTRFTHSDSPSRAARLNNLGSGLRAHYKHTQNQTSLTEAIEAHRQACRAGLVNAIDEALRSGQNWGNWALERQSWTEAIEAYSYGRHAFEQLLQVQLLRRGEEVWLSAAQGLFSGLAFALAHEGDLLVALEALEHGRARLLGEAMQRNRRDLERLPELGHGELLDRYHALTDQYMVLTQPEAESKVLNWRQALDENRKSVETCITAIRAVPGYENFLRLLTATEIQAQTSDSPLVYLAATAVGGLALVVTPERIETVWLDVNLDTVASWLIEREGNEVVGGYLPGQLENAVWLNASLRIILPQLGEQLIGPVAAQLRAWGATSVVLVPAGRLGLLPLHAAAYEHSGQTICLLDEFVTRYVPSAQALQFATAQRTVRAVQPARLAGVGNPLSTPQSLDFGQTELEDIASLFEGHAIALYTTEATKAGLLAAAPTATHLHFSCHGLFNPSEPLKSALYLTHEEPLTLNEVLMQPTVGSARLVVLSACQTAITDFNRLPDEAIGFPSGFLQAGVPGVVGTLWPVNDLSTMLLMVKFYEVHLKEGLAPAAALRKAQLWLRDVTNAELSELFARYKLTATDRPASTRMAYEMASEKFREHTLRDPNERPYAHPYYWAPFVFYGV